MGTAVGSALLPLRARRAGGLGPRAPMSLADAEQMLTSRLQGLTRVQRLLTRNWAWGGVPFLEAAAVPIGRGR